MTVWNWKAVDEEGKVYSGVWQGIDASTVCRCLRNQQLYPFKIKRSIRIILLNQLQSWKINQLYWSRLARKIAILLDSGLPLLSICRIFAQSEKGSLKKQWEQVSFLIESGEEISQALARGLFPPPSLFFQTMVKAGEQSGTISTSLWQIAELYQEEYYLKQKLKKALFYPLMLFIMAIIVIYAISLLVLPMYESLFANFQTDIPLITKILFSAGRYIPGIIGVTFVVMISSLIISGKKQKACSAVWAQRIPILRSFWRTKELIQFSGMLSRLLQAGITLAESLAIIDGFVQLSAMKSMAADLSLAVRQGRRLSPVLQQNCIFPLEALEMIIVGEESGNLITMFAHVSNMMQRELEDRLERLAKILEPALVIVMAGIVGLVALGVLLPIFEASTYIR